MCSLSEVALIIYHYIVFTIVCVYVCVCVCVCVFVCVLTVCVTLSVEKKEKKIQWHEIYKIIPIKSSISYKEVINSLHSLLLAGGIQE